MAVTFKPTLECMPICREKLFSDVVSNKVYGDVAQIWHFPGHIVITTNGDRKLFTFDCKPLANQQVFDTRFLDIPILQFPVVNCLQIGQNNITLVDSSGLLQFWEFTSEFKWLSLGEHNLYSTDKNTVLTVEVTSVSYLKDLQTLVWCEKRPSSKPLSSQFVLSSQNEPEYRVCRKMFPLDRSISENDFPLSVVVENCPECAVYAMSDDVLLLSSKCEKDQVTVHLMIDFHDVKVALVVGDDFAEVPVTSLDEALQFPDITMGLLSSLIKVQPGLCDLGVRSCVEYGIAAALSSNGRLEIFSCFSGPQKRELKRKDIQLNVSAEPGSKLSGKLWFLHQSVVGVVLNRNLCMYNLEDGSPSRTCHLELEGEVQMIFSSTSLVFSAWVLTSSQLYALRCMTSNSKKDEKSHRKLPEDDFLHTNILRLTDLQQQNTEVFDEEIRQELEQLSKMLADDTRIPQEDQVSKMFGPHLEEYWRLEKLSKALFNTERPLTWPSCETADLLVSSLMERRIHSKTERHSKLMWLSQVYPEELLNYLCKGISLDVDYIQQDELKEWQILLGLNGTDMMNFQFVCRLMFVLHPSTLFNFVRCAEAVSEQTIGVSAFVRKKHSLIYYKAACECLPESSSSNHPEQAELARARLIVASDTDNCVERALKSLLEHGLWSEAVRMLKEQAGNEEKLPTYMYIVTSAFVKNQVVSEYIEELFELMPSWKSLKFFSQLVAERPEIRQQQLSNSVEDVFFDEQKHTAERGVSLGAVKSKLAKLIEKMDLNK